MDLFADTPRRCCHRTTTLVTHSIVCLSTSSSKPSCIIIIYQRLSLLIYLSRLLAMFCPPRPYLTTA